MYCTRKVTDSVTWVGAEDRRLALFENLFPIPRGVSYNSYLILDEKTAVLDTVDAAVTRQYLENVAHTLDGRSLDYLVVNHMEPDHCACIEQLAARYPAMKVVGNAKTFALIRQFYGDDFAARRVEVKENDTLCLGKHTLHFVFAPMVHWPEVMMAYEDSEKLLFSADAFGTFGALNGNLFDDEITFDAAWMDDARRYYGNIVGKYGAPVQAALKKLAGVDVKAICPLHGPVWRSNIPWLLETYDKWSRYEPEERAVAVLYASMYGNTENAANILAARLGEKGVKNIRLHDVSGTHVSELIGEVFRCSHLVLAAPTYNNGLYPAMANFLHDMQALALNSRTVGLIGNGSWAPVSAKKMEEMLAAMKNMTVLQPVVTLKSALDADNLARLDALAEALAADLAR